MNSPDIPQLKPYELSVADQCLTITIRKEFDFGSLHQDWSHAIITMHPGPYNQVKLDMSQCGLVSSTFFAGLMQMHFHYTNSGSRPLTLFKPDPRVVRNLGIMHMQALFIVIDR